MTGTTTPRASTTRQAEVDLSNGQQAQTSAYCARHPSETTLSGAGSACNIRWRRPLAPLSRPLRPIGVGDDELKLGEFLVARIEFAVVIGVEDIEQRLHVRDRCRVPFDEDAL